MAEQMNFTKASLTALIERHSGQRVVVRDTKQRGLVAELRSGGTLTFYLVRKIDGRTVRVRIGPFPTLSVDQARKRAIRMLADVAVGKDPRDERRRAKATPTLRELFDHWMETYAKPRKRTWPEDQRNYDKFLSRLGSRKLSDIRSGDVVALHVRIGKENGKYAANRVLALLRAMYNKADQLGYKEDNPCVGVEMFEESSRDRFLSPSEVPRLFDSLDAEPPLFRDFFKLSLFVGARRSNVQAMRWEQLDLEAGTWRIPDTKNKEPLTVPLSAAALEILRERQKVSDDSPWVFPSRGRTGHLVEPKSAWKRVLKRAGLSDLRIHDLRRSLGSWQACLGTSLPIIGKSLGHRTSAATQVYARLDLLAVRASVEAATAAMVAASGKQTEGHAD